MPKTIFALAALLACTPGAPAVAAPPAPSAPPHHAMRLVRLPNGDYTVPMNELLDPAWTGKVTLHPQGPKTIVTVTVYGGSPRRHALELHPGSDCQAFGAANSIPLNPAGTGQPSRTIVSLPITALTSKDYVVAVRNATESQQQREACAHL